MNTVQTANQNKVKVKELMSMFKNTEYTPEITLNSLRNGQGPAPATETPLVQIGSPDLHKDWPKDSKYEFHDEISSNVYAFGLQ